MYSIGIDLGGTKIMTGLIGMDGTVVQSIEAPTLATEGPQKIIDRMKKSISILSEKIQPELILGIGIGAPGDLDLKHGVVRSAPNLPGWEQVPLATTLEETFHTPVYLENDANAAASAEHQYGAGRGVHNLLYLTVSTGIGSGVILNGTIQHGETGTFGELGHMIIHPDGPRCGCGNRGCLEAVASGTAIQRMAKEQYGFPLSAKDVAVRAQQGEKQAQVILNTAYTYLGIGIVNGINLYDPAVIVVGGGVA